MLMLDVVLLTQEEKDARQGGEIQISELSAQLSEALSALQMARSSSPAEPLAKLQAQLQAVQTDLEVSNIAWLAL